MAYADQATLIPLSTVLAALYPTARDALTAVKEAGLDPSAINFSRSSIDTWANILEFAAASGDLELIISRALLSFPQNEQLRRAYLELFSTLETRDIKAWKGPTDADEVERIMRATSAPVSIAYLEVGLKRSRAVARVICPDRGLGSGFLIAGNKLITNHHVLPDAATARSSIVEFNYELAGDGLIKPTMSYRLRPETFFYTSAEDDWSAVQVEGDPVDEWGEVPLTIATATVGDHVNIIQHPAGGPKQISLNTNVVVFVGEGRVQYLTDTPLSSGSPVFDADWNIIALHSGAISSRTHFRNVGIAIDRIAERLAAAGEVGVGRETAPRRVSNPRLSESPFSDPTLGTSAVASGIDRYLLHTFAASQRGRSLSESSATLGAETLKLPMLVRVANESAGLKIADIPDCEISSIIGNIVACTGSMRTLAALGQDSNVISVEGGRPGSGLDCAVSIRFVGAHVVHTDPKHPEKGDMALIAVIDDGIDPLHEAFRDANGNTRIASIWDQTDATGPHWVPPVPGRKAYGTVHTSSDINRYIANKMVEKGLTRNTAVLGSNGELAGGHGTHVTSIAAGRAAGNFAGGIAPEASIIVVIPKLESYPGDRRSIGYSISHVDALSYIATEAERLRLPVVVNVSQGQNAGAHDGTSNLEAAFDNFSEGGRRGGRVVVKSAGNERGHDGHAKFAMSRNGAETLDWVSRKAHGGPDIVELWFRACDELRFRLVDPSSDPTPWVAANDAIKGRFPTTGYDYQIGYDRFHWDNGDSRVLVTIEPGSHLQIGTGNWCLEIESSTVPSDGTVHAWLERDNDRPILFTNHLSEDFTLSIPGTARTVISVGSVGSKMPVKVATYSSYGPTRDTRDKPDLVAPGEGIIAAWGGTGNNAGPISGTSMAAPHVTGAIALLLSARAKQIKGVPNAPQYNAAQIRAAIAQSSQNFNGHSTKALGSGVLDVQAFLKRFGL